MSEKNEVRVLVASLDRPIEDASAFLAWMSASLAGIPLEHRASATIEIHCDEDRYPSVDVFYSRTETDNEVSFRDEQQVMYKRIKQRFQKE